MSTQYDAVVIGGGFKGMMTACGLHRQGQTVCIIDSAKQLGGFMSPMPWRGVEVDKGPQYLDGISEAHKQILDEITAGQTPLHALDFSYGSFWNGHYTEGFAVPDYRSLPLEEKAAVLYESLHQSPDSSKADSIAGLYNDHARKTYQYISRWCRKFLQNEAEKLSPLNCNIVTFFGRKLLLDNELSLQLKQHPLLDNILAAQKASVDHHTYNLYPLGKNLGAFRDAFDAWLQRAGVDSLLQSEVRQVSKTNGSYRIQAGDTSIQAQSVYCAATIESSEQILLQQDTISEYIRPVAQLFYLLELELERELPFYIMNYSEHSISRVTHFTAYANTSASGKSIICVEVPTTVGSDRWNQPEAHYPVLCSELEDMGIATDSVSAHQAFKVPSTYRAVLTGYEQQLQRVNERIADQYGEQVHILTPHLLTRASIMADLSERGILA